MPESYTAQETVLALLVAGLTVYEIVGLLAARVRGRSRNLSRLVSHVVLLVLLAPWLGYTYYWVSVMEAPGISTETFGSTALHLPYLLLGSGILLIAGLELLGVLRARRVGATRNLSRLVTHALLAVLAVSMVGLSLLHWNDYRVAEERERLPRLRAAARGVQVSPATARPATPAP